MLSEQNPSAPDVFAHSQVGGIADGQAQSNHDLVQIIVDYRGAQRDGRLRHISGQNGGNLLGDLLDGGLE
eukprot:CAMPEP_0197030214 /NCGR_PEP_ID=MMETSP1384-20130603/9491_1 /TAXON_ID=29189 /ORGANISM="Ammonia sp." /LENGTH=69 /DNA_ID=CAMNT_0042459513 /DNA_START=532 /DNA_END=741 /DNA_ORIENTATION=+